MMRVIDDPVGRDGVNNIKDVKLVQRLLNRKDPTAFNLSPDGVVGPKTIKAIGRFQAEYVGMIAPDCRIDPGGKTFRKLKSTIKQKRAPSRANVRNGKKTNQGASKSSSQTANASKATASIKKINREERRKFVDPRVRESKTTSKIIDYIFPHFKNIDARVISGFLNDSDLFWKVNYHWEYLIWMIDHSLTLSIEKKYKERLGSLKGSLNAVPPKPSTGYRTSGKLGYPQDSSSMECLNRRYKILRQGKREFKKITFEAKLKSKSKRSAKGFDLATAPVAHPGSSKHSTGYALDISGKNADIKVASKKLGATLVFDEKSHIHVEFKNGIPSGNMRKFV